MRPPRQALATHASCGDLHGTARVKACSSQASTSACSLQRKLWATCDHSEPPATAAHLALAAAHWDVLRVLASCKGADLLLRRRRPPGARLVDELRGTPLAEQKAVQHVLAQLACEQLLQGSYRLCLHLCWRHPVRVLPDLYKCIESCGLCVGGAVLLVCKDAMCCALCRGGEQRRGKGARGAEASAPQEQGGQQGRRRCCDGCRRCGHNGRVDRRNPGNGSPKSCTCR